MSGAYYGDVADKDADEHEPTPDDVRRLSQVSVVRSCLSSIALVYDGLEKPADAYYPVL